jgi:hypothetical protein
VEYQSGKPVMLQILVAGNQEMPETVHEHTQAAIDDAIVAGCGGMRSAQTVNRSGA